MIGQCKTFLHTVQHAYISVQTFGVSKFGLTIGLGDKTITICIAIDT